MSAIKSFFNMKPIHPVQMAFFIHIELLLIFGKDISKFNIWGPLYLSDLLLAAIAIIATIYVVKLKPKLNPFLISILVLSFLYLIYSFYMKVGPANYIIRQYAIFLYMGCSYIIFLCFNDEEGLKINITFLSLISILSIIIQSIYLVYLSIFDEEFQFRDFNYFTPMIIMGVLIAFAYSLTLFNRKWWHRILLACLCFFLALSFGHASAFLAAFTIIATFIFLKGNIKFKVATLSVFILSLLAFILFLPQFRDQNSNFRLVYWKEVLKESIVDKYGVLGHGFGVPYGSEETFKDLTEQAGSDWFNYRPEERYLAPSHNSFLTIVFHTGFISLFLLVFPLRNIFRYVYKRNPKYFSKDHDFLLLSLVGLTAWSSFNVILELPHSSTLFWLVYFSTIYSFKNPGSELQN